MGLRAFIHKRFFAPTGPSSQKISSSENPSGLQDQLEPIQTVDERSILRDHVVSHHRLVVGFDEELHLRIQRLHEPEAQAPIDDKLGLELNELCNRCALILAMSGYTSGGRTRAKAPHQLASAKAKLGLDEMQEETDRRLTRIQELHSVLSDIYLWEDSAIADYKLSSQGMTKLILTNLYGEQAMWELYPQCKKSPEEILRDIKRFHC